MPPRYLLRGCYRSLSTTPLRGSRGQQPRGAAVSAAMVAPRVGGVLRAAVVDRRSVPCHLRGGGSVAVCRSLEGRATHAPAHPAPLARGIANALPSLPSPPQGWRSREAKSSPPHRRENLGPLKWGLRGFGRQGRLWAKLPHEDLVCAAGVGGGFGGEAGFFGGGSSLSVCRKKTAWKNSIFFQRARG